jgi:hypothetical protein
MQDESVVLHRQYQNPPSDTILSQFIPVVIIRNYVGKNPLNLFFHLLYGLPNGQCSV